MKTSLAFCIASLAPFANLISASPRYPLHQTALSPKQLQDESDLPNSFNLTVMLRDASKANCLGSSGSQTYSVRLYDPDDGFGWQQLQATTTGSSPPDFLLKDGNLIHDNIIASSKPVPLIWPPPRRNSASGHPVHTSRLGLLRSGLKTRREIACSNCGPRDTQVWIRLAPSYLLGRGCC